MSRPPLAALLALAAAACSAPWTERPAAQERSVSVGDHRLHLCLLGHGSPAVILESGLGDSSEAWDSFLPRVAEFSRVVAYDRAGLGRSEPGPLPRSAHQVAVELHDALGAAEVPPPYVLVGHSAGAFYVRVFASLYPREVAAPVLVDPAHEDFFRRVREVQTAEERRVFAETMRRYEAGATPGRRAEWARLDSVADEARRATLPPVPVYVLTGMAPEEGKSPAVKQLWLEMHRGWAARFQAVHLISERSGHYIQLQDPAFLTRVIRRAVEQAGRGGRHTVRSEGGRAR